MFMDCRGVPKSTVDLQAAARARVAGALPVVNDQTCANVRKGLWYYVQTSMIFRPSIINETIETFITTFHDNGSLATNVSVFNNFITTVQQPEGTVTRHPIVFLSGKKRFTMPEETRLLPPGNMRLLLVSALR